MRLPVQVIVIRTTELKNRFLILLQFLTKFRISRKMFLPNSPNESSFQCWFRNAARSFFSTKSLSSRAITTTARTPYFGQKIVQSSEHSSAVWSFSWSFRTWALFLQPAKRFWFSWIRFKIMKFHVNFHEISLFWHFRRMSIPSISSRFCATAFSRGSKWFIQEAITFSIKMATPHTSRRKRWSSFAETCRVRKLIRNFRTNQKFSTDFRL